MTELVLVVDDQPELLSGLQLTLEAAGYDVIVANDGVEALDELKENNVDLIIADIAMPRMNGYQLFERVRENDDWVTIPFLFLTARTLDSDIRFGKELGADDYLTKPIEPEDLLSTVSGKLKRAQQLAQVTVVPGTPRQIDSRAITIGRLEIDPGRHRAWMDEKPIRLSAREFTLLEYLARKAEQVVSPQELIQVTHKLDTDRIEAGSLLRPLIRTLRRKMGFPLGETGYIENVRGVGYRLSVPEVE